MFQMGTFLCLSLLAFLELSVGVCNAMEWVKTLRPEDIQYIPSEMNSSPFEEAGSYGSGDDSTVNEDVSSVLGDLSGTLRQRLPRREERIGLFSAENRQLYDLVPTNNGHLSDNDRHILEQLLSYPKYFVYQIVRAFLLDIAAEDWKSKHLFDVFNQPSFPRHLIDAIFYFVDRERWVGEPTGEEAYDPVTEGATDDGSYSSPTVADDIQQSEERVNMLSDTSTWDLIERSGLAFKAKAEDIPEEDCTDQCRSTLQAGSIRGIPGEHFPDYSEIPITSFSCADKKSIPGFYADLETGCQVFHVCWPHRRESFLCPVGTTFNQPLFACDYWYSTNCSLSPLFYDKQAIPSRVEPSTAGATESIGDEHVTAFPTTKVTENVTKPPAATPARTSPDYQPSTSSPPPSSSPSSTEEAKLTITDWLRISKFLPVKTKIVVYPILTKSKDTEAKKPKLASKWNINPKPVLPKDAIHKLESEQALQDLIGLAENVVRHAKNFIETMKLKAKQIPGDAKHVKTYIPKTLYSSNVAEPSIPQAKVGVVKSLLPGINPRFVVKPVRGMPRVIRGKAVHPVKMSIKPINVFKTSRLFG